MARKCLRILLILLPLLGGASIAHVERAHEMNRADWDRACEYTYIFHGWDCEGLEPPKVLYTEFRDSAPLGKPNPYLYGRYYHGARFVQINITLTDEQARKTTLHEAVHYIVHFRSTDVGRCENEEIARRATAAVFGEEYDDAWRLWYACGTKY